MPVQTQMQVRRGTASSWTSTNPTLAAGELGFETDTGKFKIGTGSSTWTGLPYATGLNAITYLYNATASQTTFSGVDANGLTLAYTVGTEQVFLNGALQVRGSDYTATDGTSIVLTSGALVGDVLNVIAYGATTITDTYTQAQADAKFVQQTTNFFAGKNHIINGDFFVNQRNFSSTTTDGAYGFDRFKLVSSTGGTMSAQTFTPGTAPVSGYEARNFCRIVTTGQSGAGVYTMLEQDVEDVTTFAGQTATFSFWAKSASGTPKIAIQMFQMFGAGGSPSPIVSIPVGQSTISTSWARYSLTVAIPSIAGKTLGTTPNTSYLGIRMWVSAGTSSNAETGSLGIQSNTFDIWGVQLEAGSIATPFQTATGTIAGELAACQRYFIRTAATPNFGNIGVGQLKSGTEGVYSVSFPTEMRVTPSVTASAANTFVMTNGADASSVVTTAPSLNVGGRQTVSLAATASGLGSGGSGQGSRLLINNAANGFIDFSGEL
jgi:hypothetical protein